MLRFYYKKCGMDSFEVMNTFVPHPISMLPVSASDFGDPETYYLEVQYADNASDIIRIIPIDSDFLHGQAIKAADDNNHLVLFGPRDSGKHAREYKEDAKRVVDRLLAYGEDFERELEELCGRFPVAGIRLQEDTKVIG